jgi:hypothetical protein
VITTLSATAVATLARSFTYYSRYSSWLGDTLLAVDIPADSGNESADRASGVAERVEITVPARYRGTIWAPDSDLHPLAASGQRIRVELGIGLNSGMVEWFTRGEFVIVDVDPDDEQVRITCAGGLYLVEEAELVSPYQPTGDLATAIRAIVEPAVSVVFDPALVNRSVPTGMNFDASRIEALNELCDAWPADYVMNSEGYLYVYSTTAARTPVVTISDGAGGKIVEVSGRSTREGAYNAVVARGQTAAGAQFQAVAYDTSGGPKAYGGPFNPLPVPYFFQSPLLTDVSQASASAQTILARLQRDTSRQFSAEVVIDPRLQVGDLVTLDCAEYSGLAEIDGLRLPYDPDAPMALDLRTVVT